MDKLIKDLNLTALEQNGNNLMKISLSPERMVPIPEPINNVDSDDYCCFDGYFNHHLKGEVFLNSNIKLFCKTKILLTK